MTAGASVEEAVGAEREEFGEVVGEDEGVEEVGGFAEAAGGPATRPCQLLVRIAA